MAPKIIKHLIFAVLMLAATVLFWWRLVSFFTNDNLNLNHLINLGIGLMVFLVFVLLFLVLAESRNVIYLTFLVSSALFFLFFEFNYVYLASVVIFLIFLILAYEIVKAEKQDRLRVSLKKFWARGLPFTIVGVSLIISVVYYFNPLLKISQDEIKIPSQVISWSIKPLSGIFGKILPFYDPKMTIDEILSASSMLGEGGGIQPQSISPELLGKIDFEKIKGMEDISGLLQDPEIGGLLREEMSKQTQKVDPRRLAGQRQEFAKPLGIALEGNETLDVIFTKVINSKLGQFIGPYAKGISIGIAVALFFILRLVGVVLGWIAVILAQIVFLILRLGRVVQIEKVMKEGQAIKI